MRLNRMAAGAALVVLASSQAKAQFGRVANQPFSGGVTVINNMTTPISQSNKVKITSPNAISAVTGTTTPTKPVVTPPRVISVNLMNQIKDAWTRQRPIIVDSALAYLNEHDIGGGFRTSKNRLTLAEDGPIYVGTDAGGFTLRFVLANNVLSTYLRTPTALSGDLDPGFIVNFDLDVSIDVDIRNNQLVASPPRVKPNVSKPVGKNVTGALAVAAGDLVKTLSGSDFIGVALSKLNGRAFNLPDQLNSALAPLNPMLQKAASGGVIIAGYNEGNGNVTLTLNNAGPAPVIH